MWHNQYNVPWKTHFNDPCYILYDLIYLLAKRINTKIEDRGKYYETKGLQPYI